MSELVERFGGGDETVFKNFFVMNESIFHDYIRSFHSKHRSKIWLYIYSIMAVLLSLFFFYASVDGPLILLIAAIVFLPFSTLPYIALKKWRKLYTKKLIEQYKSRHSGELADYQTVFYNNRFERFPESTFQYNQISYVVATDVSLYLMIGNETTIIVKKDAFTIGDYESFVSFLKEKLKDNPKVLRGLWNP